MSSAVSSEVVTLTLFGKAPSKKNTYGYSPKTGRRYKSEKTMEELAALTEQIQGYERNLMLVHPDLDFFFEGPSGTSDRDNMTQTLLDLLKELRILANDSIAQCNGKITIHPATWGEVWKTTIVLTPSRTWVNHKGHPKWCRCEKCWCVND